MRKVKVGIIGTGFIGPAHIEALRRLGYVEVVALADMNEEIARKKAEILSIGKYYGDYREMLKDTEIEVVHICTPNHLHYIMSKDAMEAGKHVVCEKPMAMNTAEAEEMIKIAKEKQVVNALHFNLRFYPLMHHVKMMIENEELGRILAINGSYQQDWLLYDTDFSWRLQPEFSGESRAIADIGSHWMDLVEFTTGLKVTELCSDIATFHPVRKKPLNPVETYSGKSLSVEDYEEIEIATEDYATVLLRFNNGAHGSMTVNQVAAGRKNRLYFEVYGTKKAIGWDSERPNELWIGRRDADNGILLRDPALMLPAGREIANFPGGHNEGFPDTSKQMFAKLYKYISEKGYLKGETPDFPTFEDGHRELLLCENMIKSARDEKWIKL